MPDFTFVLLTTDPGLVEVVKGLLPDLDIQAIVCLLELSEKAFFDRLIIDPRAAMQSCCAERLQGWRHRLSPRMTHFLSLPAPPEVLLKLPQIVPGTITRLEELPALMSAPTSRSRAKRAWDDRESLLSLAGRPEKARRFLNLAWIRCRERYTVSEAALDLDLHVRRLTRLSIEWFGHPPGVIIGLSRIASLAHDIAMTDALLRTLAREYCYSAQSAMNREFSRFVRVSPGVYREFHPPRRLSGNVKPRPKK